MKFLKKNWLFLALGAVAVYFLCGKKKDEIIIPVKTGTGGPKPFDKGPLVFDTSKKASMAHVISGKANFMSGE